MIYGRWAGRCAAISQRVLNAGVFLRACTEESIALRPPSGMHSKPCSAATSSPAGLEQRRRRRCSTHPREFFIHKDVKAAANSILLVPSRSCCRLALAQQPATAAQQQRPARACAAAGGSIGTAAGSGTAAQHAQAAPLGVVGLGCHSYCLLCCLALDAASLQGLKGKRPGCHAHGHSRAELLVLKGDAAPLTAQLHWSASSHCLALPTSAAPAGPWAG